MDKDVIYRQDAIDAFDCADELIVSGSVNAQNVTNYINKVISKIKALPPAQHERKKGKWKLLPNGNALCSECGYMQVSAWDMESWDNYCHHCGADMRGDSE